MTSRNILDQFRRGLDRASFEADRLMRQNRVRAEAARLREQAEKQTLALGRQVLDAYRSHTLPLPDLAGPAGEVLDLEARATEKDQEADAIQKEEWPDPTSPVTVSRPPAAGPAPTPLAGDPQIGAASAPPPLIVPGGGDPQIGAASGPAPAPASAVEEHAAPPRHQFCSTCGAPLRSGAAFCPHCGAQQP